MKLQFMIIDDELDNVVTLKALLERVRWSDVFEIWPPKEEPRKTFENWKAVWKKILLLQDTQWNPDVDCCVLLLDVALGTSTDEIDVGLREIEKHLLNPVFEPYVKVAWTKYAPNVADKIGTQVDGILPKEVIIGIPTDTSLRILEHKIQEALANWTSRTKRIPPNSKPQTPVRTVDSAAMRRAEAGLSRQIIEGLAREVANEWGSIEVDALSGGYSGAYLLRFSDEHHHRQSVYKIARQERIISEEIDRWRLLASYPIYERVITTMLSDDVKKKLAGTANVHYMQQASIEGTTLEMAMQHALLPQRSIGRAFSKESLRIAIGGLLDVIVSAGDLCCERESTPLALTTDDIDRFTNSAPELGELRDRSVAYGFLTNDEWHSTNAIQRFLDLVQNWDRLVSTTALSNYPVCPQHGDLNPRNVLVGSNGDVRLIDYGRSGEWPAGYDLARLELQLILRLMDIALAGQYFPHELPNWITLWHEIEAGKFGRAERTFDPSGKLVGVLKQLAAGRKKLEKRISCNEAEIRRATAILRCFDSLKVCSYQDATAFKRLFFLLVAIRNAHAGGLLS